MQDYLDPASLARGRSRKRWNAITAVICGGVPAFLFAHFAYVAPWWAQVAAFAVGFLWGNAFEYTYHRWLLHLPRSSFGRRHLEHHSSVGMPNEAEHVTLGGHPLWIVVLFVVNGVPAALLEWLLHTGVAPGLFVGFIAYTVVVEEFHWRIHLNEWMPRFLDPARQFHLVHHDYADKNFSVFLPIFDRLLKTTR